MGAYNILYADVQCSECKNIYEGQVQFKFGDTWLRKYKVGDVIKWGGNDIGSPNLSEVKVYGILDSDECPVCKNINRNNEFDIFISKDVINNVALMSDVKDYFSDEGNYKICKE